jgi:hypothetical protein
MWSVQIPLSCLMVRGLGCIPDMSFATLRE